MDKQAKQRSKQILKKFRIAVTFLIERSEGYWHEYRIRNMYFTTIWKSITYSTSITYYIMFIPITSVLNGIYFSAIVQNYYPYELCDGYFFCLQRLKRGLHV